MTAAELIICRADCAWISMAFFWTLMATASPVRVAELAIELTVDALTPAMFMRNLCFFCVLDPFSGIESGFFTDFRTECRFL